MKPRNGLVMSLYRGMVEIREFELKARDIFRSGKMPGFIHLYVGEEAVAVGGLIIQPWRDHPVIGLSGFDSEVGVQRIHGIRDLLQVYLVIRIAVELGLGIEIRHRQRSVGRRQGWRC